MITKHRPEVVLTDARMPIMDGVELVRRCLIDHPGLPVLILTTFDDDELVHDAVRAGAAGLLLKDVSPERLAEAIAAVRDGGVVIDRGWPQWPCDRRSPTADSTRWRC